jgi:small subunit ribosomal protein S19e
MTSPYTTEPRLQILEVAKEMRNIDTIVAPEWAQFVKTGPHKTRPPANPDWWHIRAAAILRAVGTKGPIGVNKLRRKYGGRQRRGHKPAIFTRAGGSVIRKCLQQLEKAELIQQVDIKGHKGRMLSPKGQSMLAQASKRIAQE